MKITPTPVTAAIAGLFSGVTMPALWARLASDSVWLTLAFLLVVAVPAHVLVVGIRREEASVPNAVDTALLKRIAAWLGATAAAVALAWVLRN